MTLRPFWSVIEIVGIIAVIAPFAITMSSSSMSTVNGRITQFVYRDWLAVGGGALGALCGLGAATRFGGTMRSKRPLRAAIVLGLLGLGTFQILRGLGVVGQPSVSAPERGAERAPDPTDDPAIREAMANLAKNRPDAAIAAPSTKPPLDLEAPAKGVISMWQANQLHELYGHTTPGFKHNLTEDDLAMLLARVTAAVGPCGALIPPIRVAPKDELWTASAQLQCGKTLVDFSADFAIEQGTVLLQMFNLNDAVPAKPDVAEATAMVRSLLDDLLAAKVDHFADKLDLRVIKNLGDTSKFAVQLRKVSTDAGKVTGIREVSSTADSDSKHSFVYDVAAKNHHLTATFSTEYLMARWFVTDFNIEPADAKNP